MNTNLSQGIQTSISELMTPKTSKDMLTINKSKIKSTGANKQI